MTALVDHALALAAAGWSISPLHPPDPRVHLAKWLAAERSWGHAPHAPSDTLDRLEAAVAFAIREAARLQSEPESGRLAVSRMEVPEP